MAELKKEYGSLREKIAAEKVQRQARYTEFALLVVAADCAGRAAAEKTTPTPMTVQQHADPLNDSSAVVKQYHVPEGVCGFAWVTVRPANSTFAQWAKKNATGWRKAYGGGLQLWISAYGQSMARKEAYAQAYAEVLRAAGIDASAGSRMD